VDEQVVLLTAPLPNGQRRVTMAKQHGNHTGEHKGQFRAHPMLRAWIRQAGKEFREAQERIPPEYVLTVVTGS